MTPTRTPTPTRTSSPTFARGSSRGCLRSACHRNNFVLHEPDTHEDPCRFPSRAISLRGCRLGMRACTHDILRYINILTYLLTYMYACTVHDKLSCIRLQNYTIGASQMSVSVSVSVSVVEFQLKATVRQFALCTRTRNYVCSSFVSRTTNERDSIIAS